MVSVLIPLFNQYDQLDITLNRLCNQRCDDDFEIIIIDDKSDYINYDIINKYSKIVNLKFIENKNNKGRSATRNRAIDIAQGTILIFCDADRFPNESFISNHKLFLDKHVNTLSVGVVKETYSKIQEIKMQDYKVISRKAMYYKTILNLFDESGKTNSCLRWLATLSGNMAIRKNDLNEIRFDENFKNWGFEHFEFGYRLCEKSLNIYLNPMAENTHIAHERTGLFYVNNIKESFELFYKKHPTIQVKFLYDFLLGNISLQEYELKCSTNNRSSINSIKPIYNKYFNI